MTEHKCDICGEKLDKRFDPNPNHKNKCHKCSRAYRLFHSNHKTEDEAVEVAKARAAYRAGEIK